MKREPLLADLLLMPNRELYLNKQFELTSKDHLLSAKRFVMDAEATRYLGEMIRDVPRIIADAQDFAIPPFHTMWIEFPFDVLWNTVNPNPPPESVLGPTDKRIGFLIIGNTVRVGVQSSEDNEAAWTPVEYILNNPMAEKQQADFSEKYGLTPRLLDNFFWGSSAMRFMAEDIHIDENVENSGTLYRMMKRDMNVSLEELPDGGTVMNTHIERMAAEDAEGARQSLQALRNSHGVRVVDPDFTRVTPEARESKQFFHMAVSQSAGDLRNLIAILLFLNRTSDVRIDREVAPKQQMVGNKLRPLLRHSVITIKLNPISRFKKMVAGSGSWKKLHDVRGHFCHNERARTAPCMHESWDEIRPLYWVCPQCKGAKWWRHEHARGHEEKGIVTSEYKVKK